MKVKVSIQTDNFLSFVNKLVFICLVSPGPLNHKVCVVCLVSAELESALIYFCPTAVSRNSNVYYLYSEIVVLALVSARTRIGFDIVKLYIAILAF